MSLTYSAVQWTSHKRRYDLCVAASVLAYLAVFVAVGKVLWRDPNSISDEILALRALGSCAFILLNITLCIGPLARLDRRFLPLLFNRRHLGVTSFLIALGHALLAIGYYHGFGVINPVVSLLTSNQSFASLRGFPFELLGLAALLILFVMAATSHDFWLKNLTPRMWKSLHMLVYLAYALVVGHVALGALQSGQGGAWAIILIVAFLAVSSLHLVAGSREARRDSASSLADDGWIDAGDADSIPQGRARTISAARGERIAVFKHAGGISAVANVCAHQGGPLGEGKVIDGCVTCPWHGWQYRPQDGRSPPPFQERIATYEIRVVNGRVRVNPKPLPSSGSCPGDARHANESAVPRD